MLKIKLDKKEFNYLYHATTFLEDKYRKLFFTSQPQDDKFVLKVSEDQSDEIRDLCGEQLQIAGFDEIMNLPQKVIFWSLS